MTAQKKNPNYPFPFTMPSPARDYGEPSAKDKERIARRKRFDAIQAEREINQINREAHQVG